MFRVYVIEAGRRLGCNGVMADKELFAGVIPLARLEHARLRNYTHHNLISQQP